MRFAEQPRRMIQAVVFLAILLVALSGCQGAFKGISTVTPAPSPTGNPPLATSTTAQANSTPPATLEASPLPEATGVLTATATAATGGTPAQGSKFLLFGPFHLPPEDYGPPFTGAFASLDPSTAQSVLDAARKAGFHLIVNLAGK